MSASLRWRPVRAVRTAARTRVDSAGVAPAGADRDRADTTLRPMGRGAGPEGAFARVALGAARSPQAVPPLPADSTESSGAIEVRDLCAEYVVPRRLGEALVQVAGRGRGARRVVRSLDAVSLRIEAGEVFGLVGINGAGKTTLIKILSTMLLPSAGWARVGGLDVCRHAERVRRMIGFVSSNERSFYWRLSARQNLRFFATLYRVPRAGLETWIDELLAEVGLADVADRRFDGFSTGMRQRLAFARALLGRPAILYMDEPTKGLDPVSSGALIATLRGKIMARWQPTVLITSHQLAELESLCSRVAILHRGRLVRCGTLAELQDSVALRACYRLVFAGLGPAVRAHLAGLPGALGLAAVDGAGPPRHELLLEACVGALPAAVDLAVRSGAALVDCRDEPVSLCAIFENVTAQAEQA